MKTIKSKIICYLSIAVILFNTLSVKASVAEYNYDTLIQKYIADSPDIKILEIDREITALEYENLVDSVKDFEKDKNRSKIDYENVKDSSDKSKVKEKKDLYYANYIKWASSKKDLEIMKFTLDNIDQINEIEQEKIVYNFEQQLWQYYKLKGQYQLLEQTVEYYDSLYKIAETRYNLKMSTLLDLLRAKNQYLMNKVQLEALKNNINTLKDNIAIAAGIPSDESFEINIDDPVAVNPIDISLELIKVGYEKDNLSNSEQIIILQAERDYVNTLREVLPDNNEDLIEAKLNLRKSELNNYELEKNDEVMIIDEYYKYKSAVDMYNSSKDDFDISSRQYDEAKLAFESGQISQIELDGAYLDLLRSKVDYNSSLVDYNLAVKRLELILSGISLQ